MPKSDVFKHVIPTGSDPADLPAALETLSKSLGTIIPVASQSEAVSIASNSPGGTEFPLFFWDRNREVFFQISVRGAHPVEITGQYARSLVDGQWYSSSGVQSYSQTAAFRTDLTNIYVQTYYIPWPFTPPSGWGFLYTVDRSTGYTFVSNGEHDLANRRTTIRVLQIGNGSVSALKSLRWQLVPLA